MVAQREKSQSAPDCAMRISSQFRSAISSTSDGTENPMTVFERYADRTQTAIDRMIEAFGNID
jgi:hypothetical protein